MKEQIANLAFVSDGAIHTIDIKNKEINYKETINNEDIKKKIQINQKLILTYSSKRAKKDKRTREKALEKIEAKLNKKNIAKSDLKLSYYAKYLDIDDKCSIKYILNNNKVLQDEKLDGIKGFATNDFTISAQDVIAHYQNQYEFERKLKLNDVKFNFSQKFLRKIIEHLIALKIDNEIIPINPSDIQKQILDAIKN